MAGLGNVQHGQRLIDHGPSQRNRRPKVEILFRIGFLWCESTSVLGWWNRNIKQMLCLGCFLQGSRSPVLFYVWRTTLSSSPLHPQNICAVPASFSQNTFQNRSKDVSGGVKCIDCSGRRGKRGLMSHQPDVVPPLSTRWTLLQPSHAHTSPFPVTSPGLIHEVGQPLHRFGAAQEQGPGRCPTARQPGRQESRGLLEEEAASIMSLLGKLFGAGGKGGKAPSPQEAIQKLRETEEMLIKKQEFLEKNIEYELMTAKKNGTKNKRGE